MIVVITGDRNWTREHHGRFLHRAITTLSPNDHVVLGDARGVDTLAREECEHHRIPHTVHEADWRMLGRAAGPIRNRAMIDDALARGWPIELWYFHNNLPRSKGTRNCVEQGRKLGLTIKDGRKVGRHTNQRS